MRRLELDILFWASRAVLIFVLPPFISDVGLYEDYAKRALKQGAWPYLSFHFEYPPLAFPLMLVPAAVTKILGLAGTEAYRAVFGLLLLPFDLLLYLRFRNRPPFPSAAFAYLLLTAAMALLLFDRFDLSVGFLLALPFLGTGEPSWRRHGLAIGLGGALKLVPLSLAPLPLLRRDRWKPAATWARIGAYGALVCLPVALSCAAAAWLGKGQISFLSHHTGRGVQVESVVGSLVIAAQAYLGVGKAGIQNNFGGQHLGAGDLPVLASRVLFYGALLFSYVLLWRRRKEYSTLAASWLVMSAFVAFGYVLSPQFLLWLIPLALLTAGEGKAGRGRDAWLGLFAVAVTLTGLHFRFYWDYVNLKSLSIAGVLARNFALVALWGLSWVWLRGSGREPEAGQ